MYLILEIYGDKPVLRPDLTHDNRDEYNNRGIGRTRPPFQEEEYILWPPLLRGIEILAPLPDPNRG